MSHRLTKWASVRLVTVALIAAAAAFSASAVFGASVARASHCAYADTPFYTMAGNDTRAEVRSAIICLTNHERTARGLPALARNSALMLGALRHSLYMNQHNDWPQAGDSRHRTRDGRPYWDWYVAEGYSSLVWENIYFQSGPVTARQVVRWWMNSTGHRANILQAQAREIGVGASSGSPFGDGRPGDGTFTLAVGRR